MNTYFLTTQQRKELHQKNAAEFNGVMKQYKMDLATNLASLWSEEEWQKAFQWAGQTWYENTRTMSLTEAWHKASEEFHRKYISTYPHQGAESIVNPLVHTAFLEDFEVAQQEKLVREKRGTKMIVQVFIGLVIWKIFIIVLFQQACVAQ